MSDLHTFLTSFQSTVLGTLAHNGYPFNSYAPFYYDGEVVYIFISDISTHAKNIRHIPKASAFFIEDESITPNIFRRKRISLQCDVKRIEKDEKMFQPIMENFQAKFEQGTLSMLMRMKDFNLYALKPIGGEATFGFGEAYDIGGEKMNQLIKKSSD